VKEENVSRDFYTPKVSRCFQNYHVNSI